MAAYGTFQNVHSKWVEGWFSVYLSLINIVRLKCSTTKNVHSKETEGCFLFYSSLIKSLMFYYEKCVIQSKRDAGF